MKPLGNVFLNPEDKDNSLVYIPVDGSTAELVLLTNLPDDVLKSLNEQADTLDLVPLGMVIDFKGAV